MTYKELWEQENPGVSWQDEHSCPTNAFGRPISCPGGAVRTCIDCWNQDIPEAKKTTTVISEAIACIKDSGDRTEFSTGAVRDMREGKGRCDLMPLEVAGRWMSDNILTNLGMFLKYKNSNDTSWLYQAMSMFIAKRYPTNETDDCNKANMSDMLLEVAKHFEEGAKKYGENNWQKGIPVHCYIDSAIRHYLKWLRGDNDEPHDRAFVWNIMCCIWEVDYHEKKENEEN